MTTSAPTATRRGWLAAAAVLLFLGALLIGLTVGAFGSGNPVALVGAAVAGVGFTVAAVLLVGWKVS